MRKGHWHFLVCNRDENRKTTDSQSARISNVRPSMTAFEGLGRGDSFNASFFNIVMGHCWRDGKEWKRRPAAVYIYDPIWFTYYAELACDSSMFVLTTSTDWMTGLFPNSLSAVVDLSIQSQSLWCYLAIWVLIGDVIHRTFPWRKIQRIDVLFTPKIADSTTLRKKASAVTLSFFSATSWRMKQLTKH